MTAGLSTAIALAEMTAKRESAGARYRAAIAELQASYTELAAIDRLFACSNTPGDAQPSFRGDFDRIDWPLRHPTFAPDAGPSIWAAVTKRVERLSRELGLA
jgi:hypothetical protein